MSGQTQEPAELIGLATHYVSEFVSMGFSDGTVTCTNGGKVFSVDLNNPDVAMFGGFWIPRLYSGPTTLTYTDMKGDSMLTVTFDLKPGTNLIFLDIKLPGAGDEEYEEKVETKIDESGKEYTRIERIKRPKASPGWSLAKHDGKYLLIETLWTSVQTGDNILKILKSFKGVKSEYLQYGWGYRIDTTKVICQEQEWCLVVSEKK